MEPDKPNSTNIASPNYRTSFDPEENKDNTATSGQYEYVNPYGLTENGTEYEKPAVNDHAKELHAKGEEKERSPISGQYEHIKPYDKANVDGHTADYVNPYKANVDGYTVEYVKPYDKANVDGHRGDYAKSYDKNVTKSMPNFLAPPVPHGNRLSLKDDEMYDDVGENSNIYNGWNINTNEQTDLYESADGAVYDVRASENYQALKSEVEYYNRTSPAHDYMSVDKAQTYDDTQSHSVDSEVTHQGDDTQSHRVDSEVPHQGDGRGVTDDTVYYQDTEHHIRESDDLQYENHNIVTKHKAVISGTYTDVTYA